jgi:histidinol-phosphate/aromatic aminotransferase/cobyric acid decarboxylase-like protein
VIYNLAVALLDEGDTIAFPAPYWTSYLDIADIVKREDRLLPCPPSQGNKVTPAQLDAALAKKPKVFLFNNPSNPTGMVYSKEEITRSATSSPSIRIPGSSPTTSTTAWCSTAWATTTSCTRAPSCATA